MHSPAFTARALVLGAILAITAGCARQDRPAEGFIAVEGGRIWYHRVGTAKARVTWEQLSPSHRREYLEWITEAKRDETRGTRIARTLEWLAEGKSRNWKYM